MIFPRVNLGELRLYFKWGGFSNYGLHRGGLSYIFKVVFYQFSEEGVLVGFTQEKSIKEKLLPIKNPTTLNIYQEE